MTNMHIDDFNELASEILKSLIKNKTIVNVHNGVVISFVGMDKILASYLLDVYNDGYNDAILAGARCPS